MLFQFQHTKYNDPSLLSYTWSTTRPVVEIPKLVIIFRSYCASVQVFIVEGATPVAGTEAIEQRW